MPAESVRLHGLRELDRAFELADKKLQRDLRDRLQTAAEPVRGDAESNALFNISNIGPDWSEMGVGVTRRTVYVAPRQRGVKSRGRDRLRRPNLAPLLATEMDKALDDNREQVVREVDDLLGEIGQLWERV